MHSLKVFGSLAFASTLHMHRTKLEPRGRKCVFLGYKNDPIDSSQYDPIIHVPSQSIESTVEEHDHHPNTTFDTLHHSNIDPESLENADENHDIQSIPDTSDIENDNIQSRTVRAKHTPHYLSDYVCNTSDASAVKSSSANEIIKAQNQEVRSKENLLKIKDARRARSNEQEAICLSELWRTKSEARKLNSRKKLVLVVGRGSEILSS
ncbi:hypothetical protein KIW84_030732 [Lathyrus oleraceus]|uniref:Retroviral polymerase SH3-like domain-containing protein n=1 Tax=Pisum sativum TaxID=3888 RepID=A0A9D4XRA0_PEA|nr:hypothetical protein KIW84_030732 [Pisum sativum]